MLSIKPLLICLVIVSMLGCANTVGRKEVTDPTIVSQIKPYLTTKTRVIKLLGQPDAVDLNADSETWIYQYSKMQKGASTYIPIVGIFTGNVDVEWTRLSILIGDDGIVKKVNYRQKECNMTARNMSAC